MELDPETLMKKSFSIGEEVDCVIKQVSVNELFILKEGSMEMCLI